MNYSEEIKLKESTDCKIDANFKNRDYSKVLNDRRSFRVFLGLTADHPSPDHSTFSKFRKRLTKGKFDLIVGDILNQFSDQGLTINEGIAIDGELCRIAFISDYSILKSKFENLISEVATRPHFFPDFISCLIHFASNRGRFTRFFASGRTYLLNQGDHQGF